MALKGRIALTGEEYKKYMEEETKPLSFTYNAPGYNNRTTKNEQTHKVHRENQSIRRSTLRKFAGLNV